MIANKTHS